MGLALCVVAALIGDALFGEPQRFHPLVAFGRWADRVEATDNDGSVAAGAWAAARLIGGPALVVFIIAALLPIPLAWGLAAILLMLSIGRRSLADHARPVARALQTGDTARARTATGCLVSRDIQTMNETDMRRATIESILENSNDAIAAPLVWAAIGSLAGPAGAAGAVVLHRLANTLDAMWGYRTQRFNAFGRVVARLDDGLNALPARLTAGCFTVFGGRSAWRCWQRQAAQCASPNGGPVMCAGAGALGITLGGPASYHGQWQDKPVMGCGPAPAAGDIERALLLVDRSIALLAALIVGAALL